MPELHNFMLKNVYKYLKIKGLYAAYQTVLKKIGENRLRPENFLRDIFAEPLRHLYIQMCIPLEHLQCAVAHRGGEFEIGGALCSGECGACHVPGKIPVTRKAVCQAFLISMRPKGCLAGEHGDLRGWWSS